MISRSKAPAAKRERRGELPSMAELLAFIRESPSAVGTREIARAFAVPPASRSELRDMLRETERSGAVTRVADRRFIAAAPLPEVTVIERFGSDEDGVALARPIAWPGPDAPPVLRLIETAADSSLTVGERAAARLIPRETGDIEARVIRKLERDGRRIIGTFENTREGGRLVPADRRDRNDYRGRTWATREHLWIDRVASAWLIRRFIDPKAKFLWLKRVKDCPKRALGFDFDGAEFTHVDSKVTFEVLVSSFGLEDDAGLIRLGALVHHLDVGGIPIAEGPGFATIMAGARKLQSDDDALLKAMTPVLDSLYAEYAGTEKKS